MKDREEIARICKQVAAEVADITFTRQLDAAVEWLAPRVTEEEATAFLADFDLPGEGEDIHPLCALADFALTPLSPPSLAEMKRMGML